MACIDQQHREEETRPSLPLDVVQIVLGHLLDTRTVAAARQSCKAWRQAARAACPGLRLILPSNPADMKAKLDLLLQVMPSISGCTTTVAAGTDRSYPAALLGQLQAFAGLRSLEVKFTDSQELAAEDIQQLAALTGLTSLVMSNVSLPAATDSGALSQLCQLQQLSLVHHSKVSALMVGDAHLQVIGKLTGLTQLELQGRMCSATDAGLMALANLARLRGLSISWVPWQSQITQSAALQLLDGLKELASLQLGGAELLLPTTPYYPVAAAGGAPGGAAAGQGGGGGGAALHMGPPQQGGLIAAAVAAVAGGSSGSTASAAATDSFAGSAPHGEHMRRVLGAKALGLDTFKLQFNCCGTGVEKALLSLGDVRRKLTGLQWSYAKLSGPTSLTLLSSCTSLRTLKLRLWYQDYNLNPFELNLASLTGLSQLRTLVIDKRPPFQQQLPAQQSAISIPVTTPVLTALARAWPHLQKLQLGLARSDFGGSALEGLAGFSGLQSLSLHCYDQGFDDGHFMLPVDVAKLPLTLTKLDLMHAELFSSNSSSSYGGGTSACRHHHKVLDAGSKGSSTSTVSSCGSSYGSSGLRSCSSTSMASWQRPGSSSCEAGGSSTSNGGAGSSSNSGNAAARPGTARPGASAFTSMLSESFSLLSRQASVECSAGILEQFGGGGSSQHLGSGTHMAPGAGSSSSTTTTAQMAYLLPGAGFSHELPRPSNAGRGPAAPSRQPSIDSVASGWLQDLADPADDPNSVDMSAASNTMQQAAPRSGRSEGGAPAAARATTGKSAGAASSSSSSSSSAGLSKQPSLPPLPLARTAAGAAAPAVQHAAAGHLKCKQPIKHSSMTAAPGAASSSDQSAAAPAAPAAATGIASASSQPKPARLQNPFAAAAAAAAVHAAVGGCVAAVDSGAGMDDGAAEPVPDAASGAQPAGSAAGTSLPAGSQAITSSSSSRSAISTLGLSFSVSLGITFSMNLGGSSKSKAAAAMAAGGWQADCGSREVVPCLPALQQLQLKHCHLDGLCLDDIITSPKELRSLQLVEVCGLAPRDFAMVPLLRSLQRLTLIAAKEDSWLGLSALSLLSKLPELRHLDWVVSDRALPRNKATELQVLTQFPRLQVLTLHTLLGRCEQLHAVSLQLQGNCHVRLMTPAYCEHANKRSGSRIGRLLGAASCLIPGSVPSSAVH